MTEAVDNAPGRLAGVLDAIRRADDDQSVSAGLAEVLGASNAGELICKVADLVRLINEAKCAIGVIPEHEMHSFYRAPFLMLDTLVDEMLELMSGMSLESGNGDVPSTAAPAGPDVGTTVPEFVGFDALAGNVSRIASRRPVLPPMKSLSHLLTRELIVGLELVSLTLFRISPSPTITQDGVYQLLVSVRTLIDDVSAQADLPENAKIYITKLLRDVEDALVWYRIGGFERVASTVAAVSAGVFLVPSEVRRNWLVDRLSNFWTSLQSHSSEIQAVSNSAQSVIGVMEGIRNLT